MRVQTFSAFWDKWHDYYVDKLREELDEEPTDEEISERIHSEYEMALDDWGDQAYEQSRDSKE